MRLAPAILLALLPLAGCAMLAPAPPADPTAGLENAQVVRRVADNGDVIEEYRVAGQLRVIKVTPARGPVYYLYDRNADGQPDNDAPMTHWKLFEWN